jgi:hypothetical protein
MQSIAKSKSKKKHLAKGVAAVAFAAVLALGTGAPAFADPIAGNGFTIDFVHTTIPGTPQFGASFVGNGTVTDDSGNQIGTAVDHCDEEAVTQNSATVTCTTIVNLQDGELDITAEAPIPNNQTAYPYTFDGVVQGGTNAYDGASGDAHITAKEPGIYHVALELK